jgi:DNA polymerase IV
MASPRVFFHIDLDAFFASVEQLDRPELRGRPVVVGALPGQRGVVSACSYEARVFGIRSAMPISEAYRRCPQAVFLPVRMERYLEASRRVMAILADFTPVFQQISVDEALLDMTGSQGIFGPPAAAALRIKQRVRAGTGLSLSIGIAANRLLAKMASEKKKPDGLCEVPPGGEEDFVAGLGIEKIWGIGRKTIARLEELNLASVPAIRAVPEGALKALMGRACGSYLFQAVRGIDPGIHAETARSHSISNETTFPVDTADAETVEKLLLELSHQVMFRLLDEGGSSRTVVIKLRTADFATSQAQETLPHVLSSAEELFSVSKRLLFARWDRRQALRLIGVGLAQVGPAGDEQGELFADASGKKKAVEKAVLTLRRKHPDRAPVKARFIEPPGGHLPPGRGHDTMPDHGTHQR